MKKLFILPLLIVFCFPLFAQDEDNVKKQFSPEEWLPQAGDWSVGFSVDPLTSFLGNAFNGSTTNGLNALSGSGLGSQGAVKNFGLPIVSIMGSYMVTDNLEIRANIGLRTSLRTERAYVQDDAAMMINPNSMMQLVDIHKHQDLSGTFAIGVDYRVGKRKVQGVFGGGIIYGYQGINRDTYQYANQITEANQNPTTANFGTPPATYSTQMIPNSRLLSHYTNKGTHMVGAYAQVGVEWFVARKFAIGANVNLIVDYYFTPNSISKFEGFNTLTMQRQEVYVFNRPMQSGLDFNVDNIGANLYMAFYF